MRAAAGLAPIAFAAALAGPLAAQQPQRVVLQGRVEDAVTREPVQGARVLSADSAHFVFTDSLGYFALSVRQQDAGALHVDRLGYVVQRFDLGPETGGRLAVLLLEPAPVELAALNVVSEAALTELTTNLELRRRAYAHSLVTLDRTWLARFGIGASVLDVVRQRVPGLFACGTAEIQLCAPGRARTIRNMNPVKGYDVCIDGWSSLAPWLDLAGLPTDDVALVEVYRGGDAQVRVYTQRYLLWRARTGRTDALPLFMGC